MIRGIYISESGEIQIIGNPSTYAGIIKSIREAIPQLEAMERQNVMTFLTKEELEAEIKRRNGEG